MRRGLFSIFRGAERHAAWTAELDAKHEVDRGQEVHMNTEDFQNKTGKSCKLHSRLVNTDYLRSSRLKDVNTSIRVHEVGSGNRWGCCS